MGALARGLAQAWKGKEIRDDEGVLQALWEILEFLVYTLGGQGFTQWRRYLEGAEAGEHRWKVACRGAQNRRFAQLKGKLCFFDKLFAVDDKEAARGAEPPERR